MKRVTVWWGGRARRRQKKKRGSREENGGCWGRFKEVKGREEKEIEKRKQRGEGLGTSPFMFGEQRQGEKAKLKEIKRWEEKERKWFSSDVQNVNHFWDERVSWGEPAKKCHDTKSVQSWMCLFVLIRESVNRPPSPKVINQNLTYLVWLPISWWVLKMSCY